MIAPLQTLPQAIVYPDGNGQLMADKSTTCSTPTNPTKMTSGVGCTRWTVGVIEAIDNWGSPRLQIRFDLALIWL